jgi:hypothetical protein
MMILQLLWEEADGCRTDSSRGVPWVDLPPALTIVSVLVECLFGFVGLFVATPLLVVVLVLVKMLYVHDVHDALGDRVELPGNNTEPRSECA